MGAVLTAASGAQTTPTDDVLCYCGDGVMAAAFERAVRAAPESSFEDVCRALGVGQKCTACLLDAESVYYAASGGAARASAAKAVFSAQLAPTGFAGGFRARLLRALDRALPNLPKPRREIAPVLAGAGLTTLLAVSNQFPEKMGPRSAPIVVRLQTRDGRGAVVQRSRRVVRAGERLDLDLGEPLRGTAPTGGLAHGSCWIDIGTIGRGYVGSTRPHFILLTSRSACNLHTQAKNGKTQALIVMRDNSSERQFVSHVNLSGEPARVVCRLRPMEAPECELRLERAIAPRGADLLELPVCERAGRPVRGLYELLFESDRSVRRHWLAATADLGRISADHV
jgi:bacterioferritin-associated ferredoxin